MKLELDWNFLCFSYTNERHSININGLSLDYIISVLYSNIYYDNLTMPFLVISTERGIIS